MKNEQEFCLLQREDFPAIYAIMKNAFPENEHRTEEGQRAQFDYPAYRVYGWKEKGKLLAFLAVWELGKLRFGEHLAVAPEERNRGIGGKLLERYLRQSETPFVLEVEYPENDLAKRRIGFYERMGFCLNTFPYLQMPLQEGDAPLPLYIMSYPRAVSAEEFLPWKKLIYQEVYHISVEEGAERMGDSV